MDWIGYGHSPDERDHDDWSDLPQENLPSPIFGSAAGGDDNPDDDGGGGGGVNEPRDEEEDTGDKEEEDTGPSNKKECQLLINKCQNLLKDPRS